MFDMSHSRLTDLAGFERQEACEFNPLRERKPSYFGFEFGDGHGHDFEGLK